MRTTEDISIVISSSSAKTAKIKFASFAKFDDNLAKNGSWVAHQCAIAGAEHYLDRLYTELGEEKYNELKRAGKIPGVFKMLEFF